MFAGFLRPKASSSGITLATLKCASNGIFGCRRVFYHPVWLLEGNRAALWRFLFLFSRSRLQKWFFHNFFRIINCFLVSHTLVSQIKWVHYAPFFAFTALIDHVVTSHLCRRPIENCPSVNERMRIKIVLWSEFNFCPIFSHTSLASFYIR